MTNNKTRPIGLDGFEQLSDSVKKGLDSLAGTLGGPSLAQELAFVTRICNCNSRICPKADEGCEHAKDGKKFYAVCSKNYLECEYKNKNDK